MADETTNTETQAADTGAAVDTGADAKAAETGVAKTATAAPAGEEDLLGDVADKGKDGEAAAGDEGDKAADTESEDDDLLNGKANEGEAADAEQGDYEIAIPEGMEADEVMANEFKPVAKELGLTQEQAQGLVDKFAPKMLARIGEQQAQQWKDIQKNWATEFKNDPDVGGAKLQNSLADVARARDYLGPEFAAAVKMLGGQNNPALLKGLVKIGQALGEDKPGFGQPASGKAKSPEEILYPNQK